MKPDLYKQIYDAVVSSVRSFAPETKFVGLALTCANLAYFELFLDPANHDEGIPLNFISYRFYAVSTASTTGVEAADVFFDTVAEVVTNPKALSPSTRNVFDEVGIILPQDLALCRSRSRY